MREHSNPLTRAADIVADLLRMAQTRLEMIGVDMQRERDAIVLQLKFAMFSIIAGGIAGISAVLWAALALPPRLRPIALGALTVAFVSVAIITLLIAQRERRRQIRIFGNVVAQLRHDNSTFNRECAESTQLHSTQDDIDEQSRNARQAA